MLQFYARVVVKLELRYVQRPLYIYPYTYIYIYIYIYIEKSLPDVRLGWLAPARQSCVIRKLFACHALMIVYHNFLFAKEHMGVLNP